MRSVILCEGGDDVYFLGYLLHKCSKQGYEWNYTPEGGKKFSSLYSFPTLSNGEKREFYCKGDDKASIWGVGGKDRFAGALNHIYTINVNNPTDRIENIVIISDRDQNEISETVLNFETILKNLRWNVHLENNHKNKITYNVEDEFFDIYVCPIIIPFNENGALETVLMNAISSADQGDAFVVDEAKKYVSGIQKSGKAPKYLVHARERLKAEFSSVISIMNPTKSMAAFNEILMSHDWEKSEYITRQFGLLLELLK
jgi:hypothetical protein